MGFITSKKCICGGVKNLDFCIQISKKEKLDQTWRHNCTSDHPTWWGEGGRDSCIRIGKKGNSKQRLWRCQNQAILTWTDSIYVHRLPSPGASPASWARDAFFPPKTVESSPATPSSAKTKPWRTARPDLNKLPELSNALTVIINLGTSEQREVCP